MPRRVYNTPQTRMMVFDELPPVLRQALASANYLWDAGQILASLRKGFTVPMLLDVIKNSDAKKTNEAYAKRDAESLLKELGL